MWEWWWHLLLPLSPVSLPRREKTIIDLERTCLASEPLSSLSEQLRDQRVRAQSMSKVIGLTCHETPVRGLLQLSAVLLTSAAAVRSHQAESFLECFLPLSLWLYDPSGWRWGSSTAGVEGDPSIRPCGLQWLLFGLAIRAYHNLIRSLVRLVGGALMEEGKSVLTCGKLCSQQQALIFMMRLTLLSTSVKVWKCGVCFISERIYRLYRLFAIRCLNGSRWQRKGS